MNEKEEYVLGLDVSTKTIGIALYENLGDKGKLTALTHVTPKIKPLPPTKTQELFEKCDIFDKIYFPLSQPRYIDRAKRFKNVECIPHSVYLKASMMLGEYFYPSSGLLASIFFIDNEYDVLLHGFDFFQKEKHHYCDNNIIGTNHRPHMEKKHLIFY